MSDSKANHTANSPQKQTMPIQTCAVRTMVFHGCSSLYSSVTAANLNARYPAVSSKTFAIQRQMARVDMARVSCHSRGAMRTAFVPTKANEFDITQRMS